MNTLITWSRRRNTIADTLRPSKWSTRPPTRGKPCAARSRTFGAMSSLPANQGPTRCGSPEATSNGCAAMSRLHFVGVQGMSHDIHLEGDGVDQKFSLERGNMHTVDLKPEKPVI